MTIRTKTKLNVLNVVALEHDFEWDGLASIGNLLKFTPIGLVGTILCRGGEAVRIDACAERKRGATIRA